MDADPSTLTDEELDKVVGGEPAPEAPAEPKEPAKAEPKVPEKVEPEPSADPEPPEPVTPPEPAPQPAPQPAPSRRESLRIQKLVSALKQTSAAPPAVPSPGLNYGDALEADPEVLKQLEADRKAYGEQAYSEGIKQAQSIQFHTRLEIDAPRVEAKYPILDKDSSEFNPAVTDAINTWYLATAGFDAQTNTVTNAHVRYAEFVDGLMELVESAAGERVAATSKNIAKQAATTGLRPDGSRTKRLNLNQTPEAMNDEELDAIIAQAIPKR